MPLRNGRVVNWKTHINDFGTIVADLDLSSRQKIVKLHELLDQHTVFQDEDFADRLQEIACLDDEDALEVEGNDVIAEIYDFADDHLIWLGMP